MKLRMRHNSIRLRLGQSDVQRLRDSGECRETIQFPGGARLEYVLSGASCAEVSASFVGDVLSVSIPVGQLAAWHSSEQIGIDAEVEANPGVTLAILVEKDFRCVDEDVLEDQSDSFEHPLTAGGTCG
jgi:hypothetical protein